MKNVKLFLDNIEKSTSKKMELSDSLKAYEQEYSKLIELKNNEESNFNNKLFGYGMDVELADNEHKIKLNSIIELINDTERKMSLINKEINNLNLISSESNNKYHSDNKLDYKKIIYNDVNKIGILSFFSGINNIKDKQISRIYHRKLKNRTNSILLNQNEQINNRNSNYSMIASTVFMDFKDIKEKMFKGDDINNIMINLLYILEPIKVQQIFIINNTTDNNNIGFNIYSFPNGREIQIVNLDLSLFKLFLAHEIYHKKSLIKKNPNFNLQKYNINLNIKNSLFIFSGYKWSFIISELKEIGIEVSGGSLVKRHILSLMDYKLSLLISKISNNGYNNIVESSNLVHKDIYQSKDLNIKNSNSNSNSESISQTISEGSTFYNKLKDLNNNSVISFTKIVDNNNLLAKFDSEFIKNKENTKDKLVNKDYNDNDNNFKINRTSNDKYESKKHIVNNIRKYHTNSNFNIKNINDELSDKPLFNEINRRDILSSGSIIVENLKKIIDNIRIDSNENEIVENQIKLEKLCLEHEYNYLKNLMESINPKLDTNPLKLNIVRDWEIKLNKVLFNLIHPYVINKYSKLIEDVNKKCSKVDFYLLILAISTTIVEKEDKIEGIKVNKIEFNEGKVVNMILSIIIRLLASHNEKKGWGIIKQGNLVMDLGNQLVKRAPLEFPIISINNKNYSIIKEYYKKSILNMSEESKALVGNTLFELIIENVDILTRSEPIYDSNDGKRYNYISISDKYREHLIQRSFNPLILPMIAKPKNWLSKIIENNGERKEIFVNGGYYTDEMLRIASNYSFIHQNYKNLTKSIVGPVQADCINFINSQKYKINRIMLNFLLAEFKDNNSIFFKGFNKLHPLTNKIDQLQLHEIKSILSHNSKYYLNKNILEIAIIFENTSFYLPSFMDFRGRIYSYPSYLEYQGVDIARCLIEFAEGCEINDNNIDVVYQYLANTAGKSKLTIKNKIKWAINFINKLNFNSKDINNIFIEPMVKNIISESEDAGQFLSVLTSLIRVKLNTIYDDKHTFGSAEQTNKKDGILDPNPKFYTPICFDATCSGMQHLSALFANIEIATNSNVIGNDEEIPQDVYLEVGKTVMDTINKLEDEELKSVLSKIIINRKLMKKPVMTVPYNVGLNTMTDQLIDMGFFTKVWETLDKGKSCFYIVNPEFVNNGESLTLTSYQMGKFSNILHKAVYIKFPSLKLFKNYIDSLINMIIKLNQPIIWITPAGMKISLSYRKFESISSKTLFSNKKGISISLPKTTLNTRGNKQSFMPNFIHSMDAANIQLLVNKLLKNYDYTKINLFTIHDCFATTPNFMSIINQEVKLTFIELYFNCNYIASMHDNFIKQIESFTEIFNETEYNDGVKIDNSYIIIKKKNVLEKVYIPKRPKLINWEQHRKIFIEGIRKSKYFIN